LAYYTVFSLGPFLVIVVSVAGLVVGVDAARAQIIGEVAQLMGVEAARGIDTLLKSFAKPSHGLLGAAVGTSTLLIGATSVFGELQDALNRIWRAPIARSGLGVWRVLRTRLLSFGMILGIAFLLMVSLAFSALISALGKWWAPYLGTWFLVARVLDIGVGFLMTTGVFALIYKLIPRVRIRWRDVWMGAAITAVLFTAGRYLIGLYIGRTGVASSFGAAGSVAVIFVWVYYSSQIFLIGAEFTWVYARTFGSCRDASEGRLRPSEDVEPKFARPRTVNSDRTGAYAGLN
jgi:membrane protein